jgi:nucleotide-binding universal stress UspA family protein
MLLDPKTVAVFLDASPSGKKRAAHAAVLAHRWGAHLIGVHVVFAGVTWPPSMDYARGEEAIEQVVAYRHELDSEAEAAAIRVGEHFRDLCSSLNVSGEFRLIGRQNSAEEAIHIAFHSDLIVVGRPEPHGLPDDMSVEKLLLASGTPTLIVPNTWKGDAIGNRILVGWNATRAARRAVADSMPFLVAAKSVTVLVIDPDGRNQHSESVGSDITLHLDRHGAHANLEQVASQGFSVAAAMLGYAEQSASDLLVVGAYSHARAREILFGGTTRTLLAQTSMPTFISR